MRAWNQVEKAGRRQRAIRIQPMCLEGPLLATKPGPEWTHPAFVREMRGIKKC